MRSLTGAVSIRRVSSGVCVAPVARAGGGLILGADCLLKPVHGLARSLALRSGSSGWAARRRRALWSGEAWHNPGLQKPAA